MKKPTVKEYVNNKKFNLQCRLAGVRTSGRRQNKKNHIGEMGSIIDPALREILRHRANCISAHYKTEAFTEPPVHIKIDSAFGIEAPDGENCFFDLAQRIMQLRAKQIVFDFTQTTYAWTSGLTFLCAFAQWIDILRQIKRSKFPLVLSLYPNSDRYDVVEYLAHCGFDDYIGTRPKLRNFLHCDNDTVRLRHETKKDRVVLSEREKEIIELLRRHTDYSERQLHKFRSTVLLELLNNITEHGKPFQDAGWWVFAQYHQEQNFISLCLADNGIGVKNTLVTGPQAENLLEELGNVEEGAYLKKSFEPSVSGAVTASTKTKKKGIFIKTLDYESGARRGNGLRWVHNVCAEMGIKVAVLSNKGYYSKNADGSDKTCKTFSHKIFVGTMYNFIIPGKVR